MRYLRKGRSNKRKKKQKEKDRAERHEAKDEKYFLKYFLQNRSTFKRMKYCSKKKQLLRKVSRLQRIVQYRVKMWIGFAKCGELETWKLIIARSHTRRTLHALQMLGVKAAR